MIGRHNEVKKLRELFASGKPEFVAVYGRRRVGKTFLIDETFHEEFTFRHAGLAPSDGSKDSPLKKQLEQFYYSLLSHGMKMSRRPQSWLEAFYMLEQLLERLDTGSRQVVFLDELPWMDTPRSGFVTALEGFWNNWGCHRKNLMLIVCGSANSWVLDKVINNRGGLYNRVTCVMKLSPFTLKECEEYFAAEDFRMSRYDVLQSYMAVGGVPYYLSYFDRGCSLPQNIDRLFFADNAPLRGEYDRLFDSIFTQPETMKAIVKFLFSRGGGFTRKELLEELKMPSGGVATDYLNALVASDFVIRYVPFGSRGSGARYKLIDPFCLFWLYFIGKRKDKDEMFWQTNDRLPSVMAWKGLAFERVCFSHIRQIKESLGIAGVKTNHSAWIKRGGDGGGAQIDLLIERGDNVINVCEIKFSGSEFKADLDVYRAVLNRQDALRQILSPKTAIHDTLITTFGLVPNEYSSVFTNVVLLDDLFR